MLGPVLAGMLTVGSIIWAADLYRRLGFSFFPEQVFSATLGIAFAAVFILKPARGGDRLRVPWYDGLLALISIATGAYVAIRYPIMLDELFERKMDAVIVGTVFVLFTIEGLRRTVGAILVVVVLFFVGFALLGHLVPGDLQGHRVPIERMLVYLGIDTNSLLGIPMRVVTTIVVPFVLFGHLLSHSGGSTFFTDLSVAVMGRKRGGSAKISVTASALFGSISGSAVSNVVSTGVITIPLMRQGGYQRHTAGAIEAVASTGGQLMPPIMGAAAFLMAEILAVPYGDVVTAALIPAILYYIALFIQIDLQAARDGIARVEESKIKPVLRVLRDGWPFPFPFVVIILALFVFNYQPEVAALLASITVVAAGLFVGYKGERMKVRDMLPVLRSTGVAVLDIFMIAGAAGVIIGVLNLSGLGFALTLALVKVAQGNLLLLLLMAAGVCIVLGMGMPTLGVYILLATLVAPALVEVGVQPIAAHLFVLYYGMMSLITPPVCIAAFSAAILAEAGAMKTGYEACRLGWSAYIVPFIFVVSPPLLMQGGIVVVGQAFISAVAGVWLVSAGMVGYFIRPMATIMRFAFGVAGLVLLLPTSALGFGTWVGLLGVALAAALIAMEFFGHRLAQHN